MSTTTTPARPWSILAFAAETAEQLDHVTSRLRSYLQQHPEAALPDVARALADGSQRGSLRRAVVCRDRQEALDALGSPERMLTGRVRGEPRSIAFLFPGLGEQYVHMAGELYQSEPAFRACVDRCAELVRPLLDVDVREVLGLSGAAQDTARPGLDLRRMLGRGGAGEDRPPTLLDQTSFAQPALFIIEYALAQLWASWGIRPDAMLGYSLGEYVAACVAGVLSLPDALRLVTLRARLIQCLPAGGMLAVPRPEHAIAPLLEGELSLAAVNGEALCVVAGRPEAIDALQGKLVGGGEPAVRIQTTHAFHSSMMEPIAGEVERALEGVTLSPPRIPYLSNVTGTWITAAQATDPAYWTAHLCRPVRCLDGLRELWRDPSRVFLEVGPGRSLSALALHSAPDDGPEPAAFPSLRASYEGTSDRAVVLDTLGRLWLSGVPVEWRRVLGGDGEPARALHATLAAATASELPAARDPASAAPIQVRKGWRPRPRLFTTYVAPGEGLERAVAGLWQEALRLEAVGADDNFFELGGHSLLAISVVQQLERQLQRKLPLGVFFEHPTVAQLAAALAQLRAQDGSAPPVAKPAAGSHAGHYVLPNGLEITHQNKAETEHFYEDIFEHRTYVRHLERWPARACVFDVGANIGLFSLFVHTLDRDARIYAFEPSPPTCEVLRRNIASHGVNAKVFELGLSDAEKTAAFTFYPHSSGMSSVYGDHAEERAVLSGLLQNQLREGVSGMDEVMAYSEELLEQRLRSETFACRLRTLSSVIRDEAVERIDLLKIDVQKSELDVLRGIEPEDWGKIQAIAIEVHDLAGRVGVVEELLRGNGYDTSVQQDELYRGTGIYLVYARRPAGRLGSVDLAASA